MLAAGTICKFFGPVKAEETVICKSEILCQLHHGSVYVESGPMCKNQRNLKLIKRYTCEFKEPVSLGRFPLKVIQL